MRLSVNKRVRRHVDGIAKYSSRLPIRALGRHCVVLWLQSPAIRIGHGPSARLARAAA